VSSNERHSAPGRYFLLVLDDLQGGPCFVRRR
jgi:hypothetical protein